MDEQQVMGLSLSEWFKYHPPASDERKEAHARINGAAINFAETVLAEVKDDKCREMAFFAIQQARMFANQGATVDEIRGQE
ncbi:MAG: hypothetical protein AAFQ61_04290 [Cyanobacteria bacterium J06626_23]